MEQTATFNRTTLLRLFAQEVAEKMTELSRKPVYYDNPITSKVMKALVPQIITYANRHIHTYGNTPQPILLPTDFTITTERMYGRVAPDHHIPVYHFKWKRGTEEGGFRWLCGGKTYMNKVCLDWVRNDPKIFNAIANWNSLMPYMTNKPPNSTTLTLSHQPADLVVYEADACPICLEEWSEENVKKTAMCGHSCCWGCMKNVVKSAQPKCPVCRTNYKTNGTFTYKPNTAVINAWTDTNKPMIESVLKGTHLNNIGEPYRLKGIKNCLKMVCDITKFQNEIVKVHSHQHFVDMMILWDFQKRGVVPHTPTTKVEENSIEMYFFDPHNNF